MPGIELANQPRRLANAGPHGAVIIQLRLDLVAHAPHQQRRMVPVAFHERRQPLKLRVGLSRVSVVEAAAGMLQPEAHDHLQPQLLRLIENRVRRFAIGSHHRGAEWLQQIEPLLAARAAHLEGLAVDKNLLAGDAHVGQCRDGVENDQEENERAQDHGNEDMTWPAQNLQRSSFSNWTSAAFTSRSAA